MRVLLDTCVWGGVRQALSDAGHDVIWAGDWPADPGDEEILQRAHVERRVVVTLDKDFGELASVDEAGARQRRTIAGSQRLEEEGAR